MGQDISLTASDGFELGAYRCDPEGDTRGAVIVVQEIFGVNDHIRDVTERFAAVGYTAIAPALYDRWDKGFTSGYTPEDIAVGRDLKDKANAELDNVMADVEAARAHVAGAGKVGITGFCWGGFVTWMAGMPARCAGGGVLLWRWDYRLQRRRAEMSDNLPFRPRGRFHPHE